jgi:hypothetical protein
MALHMPYGHPMYRPYPCVRRLSLFGVRDRFKGPWCIALRCTEWPMMKEINANWVHSTACGRSFDNYWCICLCPCKSCVWTISSDMERTCIRAARQRMLLRDKDNNSLFLAHKEEWLSRCIYSFCCRYNKRLRIILTLRYLLFSKLSLSVLCQQTLASSIQ